MGPLFLVLLPNSGCLAGEVKADLGLFWKNSTPARVSDASSYQVCGDFPHPKQFSGTNGAPHSFTLSTWG